MLLINLNLSFAVKQIQMTLSSFKASLPGEEHLAAQFAGIDNTTTTQKR